MKRALFALVSVLALAGCGQDLSEDKVIQACHDQRVAMMADDADPADLGTDWPRNWKYTPANSDGWASGSWVEGDPAVMEVGYGCAVSEEGQVIIDSGR